MRHARHLSACLLLVSGLAASSEPVKSMAAGTPAPSKRVSADLVDADAVLITDANSGKVLFVKNVNRPHEVASLQKLLTALVIAEAGNLDKQVTLTAQDASCPPTKLPNSTGGIYTRRELLQAMLVLSANDAARALARDHSGSEAAFGAKMTAMARGWGPRIRFLRTARGLPRRGSNQLRRT